MEIPFESRVRVKQYRNLMQVLASDETLLRTKEAAAKQRVSVSNFIRYALERFLNELQQEAN